MLAVARKIVALKARVRIPSSRPINEVDMRFVELNVGDTAWIYKRFDRDDNVKVDDL